MRSNEVEVSSSLPERSFIEQARREQIVAGALEVLATAGYSGASLAVMARHVGISKGVISYHFAGKDDLLREVVSTVLAQGEAFIIPRVEGATSASDALERYIGANLEFLDTHRLEVVALIEVLANVRGEHGAPSPYGAAHVVAVEKLQELLVWGQRSGEFGSFSTYVMAVSIRAAIDAVSGLIRSDPSMDVAAYGKDLAGLFERAVRS